MLVPVGSNNSAVCRCRSVVNVRGMKDLPTEEYSPEKAGVGGSIPSLATPIFHTLTSLSVAEECICGVQMESKPFQPTMVTLVTTPFRVVTIGCS